MRNSCKEQLLILGVIFLFFEVNNGGNILYYYEHLFLLIKIHINL